MITQLQEISQQVEEALRVAKIKPSTIGWSIAGIVALIVSYPTMQGYKSDMDAVRKEVTAQTAKVDALTREAEMEKAQAAIANERYKQCLPVVGENYRNGTHYFVGLVEGSVPTDRITGKPLPSGTVVCDASGTTAVIDEKGAVRSTAYTGDRDIVQARLNRFRGSQFSQPVAK